MHTIPSSLTLALTRQFAGSISALAWSPDSTRIAATSSRGSVAVWDTRTGACVFEKRVTRDHLTALTWTGKGRCLLLGSKRGTLSLLHLASGEVLTSSSFPHPIIRIAYAPNDCSERFFVMAGPLLRIFTAGQAHPVSRCYATPLMDALWCPAGRSIAVLTQNGQVDVWDVAARSMRFEVRRQNAARCLTWGATDQTLTIGTEQGKIQDYDLKGKRWGNEYPVSRFPLAALFRGELGIVVQSANETVLWTHTALRALAHSVQAIALDPCGSTLATAHATAIRVDPLL